MQFSRKIITTDNGLLPSQLLEFLHPKDSMSVTIGNTLSNQRISWLACEDKLAFVNNFNNDVLILINLSDYLSGTCVINCGEEFIFPGCSSSVLIFGCETNLGGLLLFYHLASRRMIRIIEIDVGVSVVNVLDNCFKKNALLPDVLLPMDGILVVGGIDGSILLVDLQHNNLRKAMKGEVDWNCNNWSWPSKMNKLQYIYRHSDNISSIKQKYELCRNTHDSLAFLLNDNEGELIAPKHGHLYSGITCLHYSSIVAALFVGYEVGVWQMWSVTELQLRHTSKNDVGQGVSVVGLNLMEPCDDPRHYLYLWVGHSRPTRPAFLHRKTELLPGSPTNFSGPHLPPLLPPSQEPPFSLIYSLAFNRKSYIESYGLLYSEFYKCDDTFELDMIRDTDNFVSGRILSVNSLISTNPLRKYHSNKDEDNEVIRVWSIVWECEFDESVCKSTYVTLFDLNQWYNKMPGRPETTGSPSGLLPIPDTPYLATWHLPLASPDDNTLSLWIDPQSLSALRFLHQLDVHYYPSNISFSCIRVGLLKVCRGEGLGVVSEVKEKLRFEHAATIARPENLMHTCISIGFFPNFDDLSSIHSITINADIARRYLLTLCIENGLPDAIIGCARHWFDSACTETSVSLDYIVDFLWDLFNAYQKKLDDLCICLFDYSDTELSYQDSIRMKLLKEHMKEIKSIYFVLKRDYSTFKKIGIVEHRYLAIDIKTFYVDLIMWFLSQNLLPECSPDSTLGSVLPYNYQLLRTDVCSRRKKCSLLIDEMIKRCISGAADEWKKETGDELNAYPPPSLQDIIRVSLIADVDYPTKHFFILYFLQDLLECLSSDKYKVRADKIIHSYEAYFKLREGQMRIVLSSRDLDVQNYKDSVERLLHRSVKNNDLDVWEHRHIIQELYKHKEYALAFRYLKGMQPPLGSTDDTKIEISLNVALGNVSSAFFITQQWSEKRSTLLNHFFRECLLMNKVKDVYPLPFDKFEEKSFLEFLHSSDLKIANDLVLYYYINRRRYAEAFVLYDQMKRMGQCGGQDENSRKRDMLMKNLEMKFEPKLLLLQKSIVEAKHVSPPSGFFDDKWKPTSTYLKFDNSDPKRPLLKSSIKDLAYITVWQGQKISKMQERAEDGFREKSLNNDSSPIVERILAAERIESGEFRRKRPIKSDIDSIAKKPKLIQISLPKEPSTPINQSLNYSIIQEMISTPKIEPSKTPHRKSPVPGPPSILRVRSGKKDEVSSCDDSSSTTPRKTLKFTLPPNADGEDVLPHSSVSRSLRLEYLSDDNLSSELLREDKISGERIDEPMTQEVNQNSQSDLVEENNSDIEFSHEEEEQKEEADETGTNTDDSIVSIAGSEPSLDAVSERSMSLEDRLEQLKSRNPKVTSFMTNILSPKENADSCHKRLSFSKNVESTFISSHLSEKNDSDIADVPNLEAVSENREPTSVETGWLIDNESGRGISEEHYDIVENNSSASDSMDKVYTSIGAPVRKLSTIFENECENEEPCVVNDQANTEITTREQKDNFGVIIRTSGNFQESDLGDEKLDQESEYNIQFGHEGNYHKDFDSESENNNEDGEDNFLHSKDTHVSEIDHEKSDSDVICLDSDSDSGSLKERKGHTNKPTSYSEQFGDESSCKSSISDRYSDEDGYEEEEYEESEEEEDEQLLEEEFEKDESEYEKHEHQELYDVDELSDEDEDRHDYHLQESNFIRSDSEHNSVSSTEHEFDSIHSHKVSFKKDETFKQVTAAEADKITYPTHNIDSTGEIKNPSAVSPVDPSLLEKIVTFSRTVSDEQLKGLVDAVKTSIDATKSKKPEESLDNVETVEICDTSSHVQVSNLSQKEIEPCKNLENKAVEPIASNEMECDTVNLAKVTTSDLKSQEYHTEIIGIVSDNRIGEKSLIPFETCQEKVVVSDDSRTETNLLAPRNSTSINRSSLNTLAIANEVSHSNHSLPPNVNSESDVITCGKETDVGPSILEAVQLQPITKTLLSHSVVFSNNSDVIEYPTKEFNISVEKVRSEQDFVEILSDSSSENEIKTELSEIPSFSEQEKHSEIIGCSIKKSDPVPTEKTEQVPTKTSHTNSYEDLYIPPKSKEENIFKDSSELTSKNKSVNLKNEPCVRTESERGDILVSSKLILDRKSEYLNDALCVIPKTIKDNVETEKIHSSVKLVTTECVSKESDNKKKSISGISTNKQIEESLILSKTDKDKIEISSESALESVKLVNIEPGLVEIVSNTSSETGNKQAILETSAGSEEVNVVEVTECFNKESDNENKSISGLSTNKQIEDSLILSKTEGDKVEISSESALVSNFVSPDIVTIVKENIVSHHQEPDPKPDLGVFSAAVLGNPVMTESVQNEIGENIESISLTSSCYFKEREEQSLASTRIISDPSDGLKEILKPPEVSSSFVQEKLDIDSVTNHDLCSKTSTDVKVISGVSSTANEYESITNDTKKPESLVDRLIEKSVHKGDSSSIQAKSEQSAMSFHRETIADSSNEHVTTIIEGNKPVCKSGFSEHITASSISVLDSKEVPKLTISEDVSECLLSSEIGPKNEDISSFNTAICEQDCSLDVNYSCDESSILNRAVVYEDSFSSALKTPCSKRPTMIENNDSNNTPSHIPEDYDMTEEALKNQDGNTNVSIKVNSKDETSRISQGKKEYSLHGSNKKEDELGTAEVGREVKKRTKTRKKVEMVDKCVMTDKRRHSKLLQSDDKYQTQELPPKSKTESVDSERKDLVDLSRKSKFVDRSMITDKRGIDITIVNSHELSETPRRSRRRSSSLQPDERRIPCELSKTFSSSVDTIHIHSCNPNKKEQSQKIDQDIFDVGGSKSAEDVSDKNNGVQNSKTTRYIRKAMRRSGRRSHNENYGNRKETLSEVNTMVGSLETSPSAKSSDLNEKHTRKIRKIKRRSSIASSESDLLRSIPEHNVLNTENDVSFLNNQKIPRSIRASSVPNITYNDKSSIKGSKKSYLISENDNLGLSKYSSLEDFNTEPSVTEVTPRRSKRLSKTTDSCNSISSSSLSDIYSLSEPTDFKSKLVGRQLEFNEEQETFQNSIGSRKHPRRSKLSRKSNLEDIVEVSESDMDVSHSREKYFDTAHHNLGRRHTLGMVESKTDNTLLVLPSSKKNSRRRTQSSSSEPHFACYASDSYSDAPAHWLRSLTKSEGAEKNISSFTSAKLKSDKIPGSDSHKNYKSHSNKSKDVTHFFHSSGDKDSSDETDTHTQPRSPISLENSSSPKKTDILKKKAVTKGAKKSYSLTAEAEIKGAAVHGKPVRGRRRSFSFNSEPPLSNQGSPVKTIESENLSVDPKKRVFANPVEHLTGYAVLSAGAGHSKRRSKSLHEWNNVVPFKPCNLKNDEITDAKHDSNLPSTSHSVSPQLTALLEDYPENRRLTRHQRSLIERSLENTPKTPENVTTPKKRRRSCVVASSDDEAHTPVRSSRRLQDKGHKVDA